MAYGAGSITMLWTIERVSGFRGNGHLSLAKFTVMSEVKHQDYLLYSGLNYIDYEASSNGLIILSGRALKSFTLRVAMVKS